MEIVTVIPARMASSRLPGKPLLRPRRGDPTILEMTYNQAKEAALGPVFVATPDMKIIEFCDAIAVPWIKTGEAETGTQRTARAVPVIQKILGREFLGVISLQCDEPQIPPEYLRGLARKMEMESEYWAVFTLVSPLAPVDITNQSVVKAACTSNKCHWFTRYGWPGALQHTGVYGWKTQPQGLNYALTTGPTAAAQIESLEQISWLERNIRIIPVRVAAAPHAVNTPEDLEELAEQLM